MSPVKAVTAAGLVSLSALFAGCANLPTGSGLNTIPTGHKTANTHYFSDYSDFENRCKKVAIGMSLAEVYDAVGVDYTTFRTLDRKDASPAIYGNAVMQPRTKEEAEKIREEMARTTVLVLHYQDIREKGNIAINGNVTEYKKGADVNFVVIAREGKVIEARIEGDASYNEARTENILWKAVPRAAVNTAIGVAKP